MDGTLALYKGDTLLQSREISMASHTLSHSLFEVHEGDLPQLSVRAACQDGFQEDNQLVVSSDAGYILFVADDIPAPIRACVDANRVIQRKDRPDHADFPVAWADSVPAAGSAGIYVVRSPSSVQAAERILLTQHLYRNDQKRISMGYDLSAAFGSGLTGLSDRAVPLLTTSEGKIAAAVERFGEKASLFLDEGLFSEQSTVWKQPQFPELFQRWIELLYEYNGFRQKGEVIQRDPVYADLWTVDAGLAAEPQVPEPAGHAVSLYPWVLGLSLLFLGIETAAYYRGRIV
jgi:hypothetical protein